MLILLPLSRATDFKLTRVLLFVFFTFFMVSNSYADKIYTVQKNDFLSKIVKKNYSIDRNMSKEQVMVAILRANPKAFRGGNIHYLKRVDALTLPSTEAIALIPHTEALKTVNKHYTFFKRHKTGSFPPIPLERPTQKQNKDNATSDSTETAKTTTDNPKAETSTETETIASTSSTTENSIEKQQQTTTIKNDKIQELEQKKEEQDTTIGQLDSKIKTLEESITDQATTPQSNTETALPSETISGLDSLADLNNENADNDTAEKNTIENTETISGLDSLADLSNENADNDTAEKNTIESTETISSLDSLADLSNENADNDTTDTTESTATISGLDSLADLSNDNTDNGTAEKTSNLKKPIYLWLLLPIFALLGLLWWKKSKIPTTTEADTNVTTSLEKKTQPQQRQTKKSPHHSPSIEKAPTNNRGAINDTEKPTTDNEKAATHSSEEESAIKLDMASAYQAMGYPEEAKEMLEEVIQEGTSQQKEMAENLLAVL